MLFTGIWRFNHPVDSWDCVIQMSMYIRTSVHLNYCPLHGFLWRLHLVIAVLLHVHIYMQLEPALKGSFSAVSWPLCLCGWSLARCQSMVVTPLGGQFNPCFIVNDGNNVHTANLPMGLFPGGSHLYFSMCSPSSEVFAFGTPLSLASMGFVGCLGRSTSWVSGTAMAEIE